MNVILDTGLIWFEKCFEKEMLLYLDELTEFIDKYLIAKYLKTTDFLNLLCMLSKDPMGEYRESCEFKDSIVRKIFRCLDDTFENDATANEQLRISEYLSMFTLSHRKDLQDYTKNVFSIMNRGKNEYIFFLSPNNFKWESPLPGTSHIVKDIFKEVGSYLSILLSTGSYIKAESMFEPSLTNPLPNVNLCKEYSRIREQYIEKEGIDKSTYLALGQEVAFRNGYTFNSYLTKINNAAIRQIYSSKGKTVVHLSVDVEHGAFELCDEAGHHRGEYSYEGKQIGPKKANHDIKIKK